MSAISVSDSSYVFDYEAVFDVDNYLYFYEETLAAERTEAQVDFFERHMNLRPFMRVLDVGCGHGRHANELAARGYSVVGVDRMQGFIDLARREAERRRLDVDYKVGDALDIGYDGEMDGVVCLFDVFGVLRDEQNTELLRRMHRALKPGAALCLDVRNRDWMVRALLPFTVMQKGKDLMIDRHAFDPISGRLVDHRVIVRDGRVTEAPFSVRLYTFAELRGALESVGFTVTAAFGAWDGSALGLHQNRMVIFAEKAATT